MTNRVILVADPFGPPSEHEIHVVNSHAEFLASRWKHLPPYMALYHGRVSTLTNVTPKTKEDVDRFMQLEGDVYAVQYPHDISTAAYIAYALIFVAVIVMAKGVDIPPVGVNRNTSPPSANNDLSSRTNKPRPNARIPDIYGEVISIPDVLTKTYSTFVDHEEREHGYFCIGRGAYEITEIKDDTTLISQIEGASANVFGPGTSPNSPVVEPEIVVGEEINERLMTVVKTEAVNGQSLPAPNEDTFSSQFQFLYPDTVIGGPGLGIDFTELYIVGDQVTLSGDFFFTLYDGRWIRTFGPTVTFYPDGTITGLQGYNSATEGELSLAGAVLTFAGLTVGGQDLSGIYLVATDDAMGTMQLSEVSAFNANWAALSGSGVAVDATTMVQFGNMYIGGSNNISGSYEISEVNVNSIKFLNARLVNNAWATTYNYGETAPYGGGTISASLALNDAELPWVGPFDVPLQGQTNFIANFIAVNGLYKDNGTIQSAHDVELQLEYTPVSSTGVPLGLSRTYTRTIEGSSVTQTQRALTISANVELYPAPVGRFRARKITPRDTAFTGQVVDNVQWKDLYVTAPITQEHFGDVTTVQTITVATKGALSLKNRKLNMRVVRKIPILNAPPPDPSDDGSWGWFGDTLPSRDVADIIAAVAVDPKIGGRSMQEIDFRNLYETSVAIRTYFNRNAPSRFSHTFDDDNMSFEDTLTAIADACFCTAYRRGNVIRLAFERETDTSSLLFCHRNKIPGSEKRTTTFGIDGNYDGVEYEYVDPLDSAPQIIRLPADGSAIKPKTIKSIGVRSYTQAYIHANRAWNKIRYRRTTVEFVATREAELLLRTDRILVANNVRQGTQDGEIRAMDGLIVTTSQRVLFDDSLSYVAFLQGIEGSVHAVPCYPGGNEYEFELDYLPPTDGFSVDPANYALTTYTIVEAGVGDTGMAFLVDERSYESPSTSKVTAYNYDARYYENDLDNSARILRYTDYNIPYSSADDTQKETGGFWAEESSNTIPPSSDPPYVFDTGYNED